MASVRVATMLFCPLASMAFIVTSFHCRTSFARGWATARLTRHATRPAVATTRPRIRALCFMAFLPVRRVVHGNHGVLASQSRAASSTDSKAAPYLSRDAFTAGSSSL